VGSEYKEQIVQKKEKELVRFFCDICGREGDKSNGFNPIDPDDNQSEVTIQYRKGWSCSDGGSGTEIDLDVCPQCFEEKILPFLKSISVPGIAEKEWDW
jgi:hypothetical protein